MVVRVELTSEGHRCPALASGLVCMRTRLKRTSIPGVRSGLDWSTSAKRIPNYNDPVAIISPQ